MEKKNTILLTVIAIATLLVAVVGATFAYFASNINTKNGNVGVSVNTSNKTASFIATASGNLNLNVEAYMMQESYATQDNLTPSNNEEIANLLTANATLNVSLTGTGDDKLTTCSYDVVYTWTGSESNFTDDDVSSATTSAGSSYYPSKYYIRSQEGQNEGFKEFTIELDHTAVYVGNSAPEQGFNASSLVETNLDELKRSEKDNTNKTLILKSGETITSSSSTEASHVDYLVTIKFYNLGTNQDKLIGKTFSGTVSIANVVC